MIRKGIKNYFTNLRHFFSSLGAFALGVVLGVSVLIPGIVAAVQTLGETIADVTGSADLDFHALLESVVDAGGQAELAGSVRGAPHRPERRVAERDPSMPASTPCSPPWTPTPNRSPPPSRLPSS